MVLVFLAPQSIPAVINFLNLLNYRSVVLAIGKKEIMVQQQHAGFNVRKSKSNGSVTQRLKRKWHITLLLNTEAGDQETGCQITGNRQQNNLEFRI